MSMLPGQADLSPVAGCHVLAALSGGADSTALLILLSENRDRYHLKVTAAHLNHMIRGSEADKDEAFCRELCAKLGINLIHTRIDIPAAAAASGTGLETCARDERYRFLRKAAQRCGADVIALAHHADDQTETVLMHLFRGTGPEGICGMPVLSGDLFRPLLSCSKSEILAWLKEKDIRWREDATNTVPDNPRNVLRLNIIPEIEAIYPGMRTAVQRFTRSAAIENDLLARMTREYLNKAAEAYPCGTRLNMLVDRDEAILRRAIRAVCGPSLTFDKLEEIVQLAHSDSGKTEFDRNTIVERTGSALWFTDKNFQAPEPVQIETRGTVCLEKIARIEIVPGHFPIDRNDPMTECIDLGALAGSYLRTRRSGDRIHPLGAPGTRLLSDCMTDKKLERPLRDCLPLIAQGDRVLWCLGIGISEDIKITAGTEMPGCIRIQLFHPEEKYGK